MLKVGVVGVGSISQFHIEPYLSNEQVELVALCDLNEDRLQENGKRYDVAELYTDYHDLLKNEAIDAVSICTWNNSHAEIAIAAMEAGKHVLVEKPLSMTVDEALAVEATQRKTGKLLQVGFVRRHGDNAKLLKTFIDHGELGEIYYAKTSCLRRLGNPGGWFSDITKSGGGPLIDLGVHMIDICWYFMGKPRPVSVSGNTYKKLGNRSHIGNLSFYKAADYDPTLNDVEDLTNAMIRFENGASIMVDVSFTLQAKKDELYVKLFGDKGGAEIEPELAIVNEKHNTILNVTPQIDKLDFDFNQAFVNEINHFVDCCLNGTETIAPVSDGVQVMKMLNAVYESAKTGKEVYM
ncbi:Gfo/Idh/MocA family oxidoreductase [Aquibacillus sp. 3ASR75-11]|uniref:Gfo/Idh/MocA family oxidoreductase n=1 Tax=Terrihalobacillus insolitus TaxID=2950438 RepID=A0A9X3WN76_9BACI|nr:Gfo/Idh/MocA family oxidoreductase [Terrihalobacillus insolitus]MDC3412174.1 Gfo/Idh/MocA family oxidoreductase [Terrihalobacillus insolitus]MDC3423132.1 Gfo/Idh/MocA family oxidoreductase [Terrihalobacillus insolitus]